MIFPALQPIFTLDLIFSRLIQTPLFSTLDKFFWFVTNLGNVPSMPILVLLTLIILFYTGHRKVGIFLFWSTSIGVTLSTLLKTIISRPRPTPDLVKVLIDLQDFSFPSSHTAIFTIFFGFLYFYLGIQKKRTFLITLTRTLFLLLIVSVGFSRIYLGVHWLSDCLAGYLLGYLILKSTTKLYQKK